ncbi:MAG TPA: antitoxin Xre-like helix-turn-helix domain-containing protein [Bryobacteraceae bacterium]|nr:antitoxin Xre-like helix-turn-helix domain-containing protein [Bryobacteraceae bacterium]
MRSARTVARPIPQDTRSPAAQRTLTRAVLNAAELLAVPQAELATILGVSAATVSRMASDRYLLQPDRKEWQLAVLFVRLFRSLDSITGGRDELSRAWLRGHNHALASVPATLLGDIESFVRVIHYLDASRAAV